MVICSCNVLTEENVISYIESVEHKPTVKNVLTALDCGEVCGTCAATVKNIINDYYGEKDVGRE